MSESESLPEAQKALLQSQIQKIDNIDFENSSEDATRNLLAGLLSNTRGIYESFGISLVTIPPDVLPSEIREELEEPYGLVSIGLGKGPDWARVKEDRGKEAVAVEGLGPGLDIWILYFVLDTDKVRLREESGSGKNSVLSLRFVKKYKDDQKTLMKMVGQLTKASLNQTLTPAPIKH